MIISILILAGIGITIVYGKYWWQTDTDGLCAKFAKGQQIIEPKFYSQMELEGFPAPVERFFRKVLKDGQPMIAAGQPMIAAVKLSQRGQFNMSETNGCITNGLLQMAYYKGRITEIEYEFAS